MCYIIWVLGELAQLARASALHAEGQGFESPILHQVVYNIEKCYIDSLIYMNRIKSVKNSFFVC